MSCAASCAALVERSVSSVKLEVSIFTQPVPLGVPSRWNVSGIGRVAKVQPQRAVSSARDRFMAARHTSDARRPAMKRVLKTVALVLLAAAAATTVAVQTATVVRQVKKPEELK